MHATEPESREELLTRLAELRERIDLLESERPSEDTRAGQLEDDLRLARLLAEAAANTVDSREVARIISTEIQRVYDLHSVNLYILSPDGESLEMQNVGISPGLLAGAERVLGTRIPLVRIPRSDESRYWRILEKGEVTVYRTREEIADVINDFQRCTPIDESNLPGDRADVVADVIKVLAFESSVHIPLVSRGQHLGILTVSARRQLTDPEVRRLTSIGQQVSGIVASTRAEQDWRRERDRADGYLAVASGPLMLIGLDGTVQSMNPAGCRLIGLPEDQIVGRSWLEDFVPEPLREEGRRALSGVAEGIVADSYEMPVLSADGHEHPVRWRAAIVRDDKGQPAGILASGVDLTQLKESEERETRARRRFRAIIENATEALLIVNADGFVTYVSPSLTKILGYEVRDMMGRNCFEFVHPDDAKPLIEQFRQANVRGGHTPSYEMRIRHKDGSWRVLEGKANHLLDNPDIQGIILAARDVTDRVRIEDSIERSAARFRALLENSHELMLVLGSDLRIRYASPSCSRDLGYTDAALAGLSFEEIVHGGDLERELFDPESHQDGPVGTRMRLRTEHREWINYEVTVSRFLDDPAVEGFIVNATRSCCQTNEHDHKDS